MTNVSKLMGSDNPIERAIYYIAEYSWLDPDGKFDELQELSQALKDVAPLTNEEMSDSEWELIMACREFFEEVCQIMFDTWDLDGGTFQDLAVKHGLLVCEKFDPDGRHANLPTQECEPGEDCYFNVFALIKEGLYNASSTS